MSRSAPRLLHAFALCVLIAWICPGIAHSAITPDGIEIDGNYTDDPASLPEDWFPGFPPIFDPIGSADATLCATSPAPKNDISNSFIANNFDYLFIGMERLANTGQTSFFWSFDLKPGGPSKGDFIFVFCFGSGETVTDTYVLEFDEGSGVFLRDATPPTVDFRVNTERIPAPFGALDRHGNLRNFIDPGTFAEASITLAEIEGFDICAATAVILEIQTKSSCSLSSQCKDTTGPLPFSFYPIRANLALEQPDPCEPVLIATAGAADGQPPYTYRWYLDGAEITQSDPTYATSDTIVIPLQSECGPTKIGVEVTDGVCTVTDEETIDVNRAPVAAITTLAAGACDMTVRYDGSGSTDCNTGQALLFAWDLTGDGIPDSTEVSGAYTFPACGERDVTLVVSDGLCFSVPAVQPVYVNQPPVAGIRIAPLGCMEVGWRVTSLDCDLLQSSGLYTEQLTHTVEMGDGSPVLTDPSGEHTYATCGSYPVQLTTTDASGCPDSVSRTVTIDTVVDIR